MHVIAEAAFVALVAYLGLIRTQMEHVRRDLTKARYGR